MYSSLKTIFKKLICRHLKERNQLYFILQNIKNSCDSGVMLVLECICAYMHVHMHAHMLCTVSCLGAQSFSHRTISLQREESAVSLAIRSPRSDLGVWIGEMCSYYSSLQLFSPLMVAAGCIARVKVTFILLSDLPQA